MNEPDLGASASRPGSREPSPSVSAASGFDPSRGMCGNCLGSGWVCENHPDSPWGGMIAAPTACECGAGSPCPVCSLELASAGYVERERQRVVAWLRDLDANYSGWNQHDEQYDSGYNSAIKWVADSIEKRADTGHQPSKHGKVIRDIEGYLARDSDGSVKRHG